MNDNSVISMTLGDEGAHSTLARTGGTWTFDTDQTFSFNNIAGGTYEDIITGLTGSEEGLDSIASWTVENANWVGVFSYDGSGNVDLQLSSIPESSDVGMVLGAISLLLVLGARRSGRFLTGDAWRARSKDND
jgi:hypothetical protein